MQKFVCSGTATLEASLIGTPLVLAYIAKKFDYMIAKRFVKLKYAGLANLLLDFSGFKPLHVELIQDEVTSENLYGEYIKTDKVKFFKDSIKIREILKNGALNNMLDIITKN